jgi:Lrp/AsnC family transcriptional regulator, leucine-responsive regulatory protein
LKAFFERKFLKYLRLKINCMKKEFLNESFLDDLDLRLLDALQDDAGQGHNDLARALGVSPATVLRRSRRLQQAGVIERRVALLQPERLAACLGHGLTAVVEVSLDRQGQEHQQAFEATAIAEAAVQQCYRVSPGPDFVLVLAVRDMPAYQALCERLFTQQANVRHVRAFFSVKRAKFDPRLPLPSRA